MSVLWGFPYLLIKEAVATLAPASVVAGRTLLGAVLLLPLALRRGALRPAFAAWRWVLAFGVIEMAGPFLLLSHAEQTMPSGLTGLLVSTVPLFGAVVAFAGGDRSALAPQRLLGLALGSAGVAIIVGGTIGDGSFGLIAVAEVLVVALCYAIAPFIVAHRLDGVPGVGTATLALGAVGLAYLPVALLTQDGSPSTRSLAAVGGLGVVCTAVAFVAFFALIAEVGPSRATVFTYVNPVVALTLGVVLLSEPLTWGLVVGFPVVLAGCWLAASHRAPETIVDAVGVAR